MRLNVISMVYNLIEDYMKYLFFDIECSNCFNGVGKMCEYGYVLYDENLVYIKGDDIPMSPGKGEGNRFHLKSRKHEKDIELAYEYEFYYSLSEFPHYYHQIKKLMEDPDTICFAYSMDNDISHLYHACSRYKLKPLEYICYDVQLLVASYLNKKGQMSLHNACKAIVGPNSTVKLQEHLSRDDAEMEKLIFEAICVLTNKKPFELLNESLFARTSSVEYIERLIAKGKQKQEHINNRFHYYSLVAVDDVLNAKENIGKRYNVSGKLKKDKNKMSIIINTVTSNSGLFSGRINQTDIFIAYDEKNKKEIVKGLKHPFEGKIITYQEFIDSYR